MNPLICTQNTQSHVDYGIPLIARKSTDYRTSTGKYHEYIPDVPKFCTGCRVQARIKPELKSLDVTLRDDRKSSYNVAYGLLSQDPDRPENKTADHLGKVHYIRPVQEQIVRDPPPPIPPKLSEMKDNYRMNYYRPRHREILDPISLTRCEIDGIARPLQPPICPGEPGLWKYLDIYMTDNRLRYPPYSKEQRERALEDLPTFYSACGKYKQLRTPLPGPLTGNPSVYDKALFKHQCLLRCFSRSPRNVPNMKFKTEYSGSYVPHTYSDLYPFVSTNGQDFGDCLSGAGPWQNLCPPGMYCTEYCHIGTGWPINAVVDTGMMEPPPPHN